MRPHRWHPLLRRPSRGCAPPLRAAVGVAESLTEPTAWLESTAELRRELKRKRQLVREALHEVCREAL